jgi:hypothetical protein
MAVDKVYFHRWDTEHWIILEKQIFPRRFEVGGSAFSSYFYVRGLTEAVNLLVHSEVEGTKEVRKDR